MEVRYNTPLFSAVLLIAFIVSLFFFVEAAQNYSRGEHPLVSGKVIAEEMGDYALGIQRPVLVIQLAKGPATVRALLSTTGATKIPPNVTFHYSGDPSQEVFLEEENNPLWIGLALMAAIIAWITLAFYGIVSDPVVVYIWNKVARIDDPTA